MRLSVTSRIARRRAGAALVAGVAAAALATGWAGAASAAARPVPWGRVTEGWALADYTTAGLNRPGPTMLYLVSPAGTTYLLHRWPASQSPGLLTDWSGDKKRALFVTSGGGPSTVEQLTLTSGKTTTFRLPTLSDDVLGYTAPLGENILVATGDSIARFSLAGVQQASLISGAQYTSAIAAPDGLTDVVGDAKGLTVVSSAGGVVRRLPVPDTEPRFGCAPERWWNSRIVLTRCTPKSATEEPRLWLVPVSGAAPRALTPVRNGRGIDLGDFNAWRFPSGLYINAFGACGTVVIGRQAASGRVSAVGVPGSSGSNVVAATSGHRMLVQELTPCQPASSLAWFNPATHAVRKVLRAHRGEYGVLAVMPYDGNGEER